MVMFWRIIRVFNLNVDTFSLVKFWRIIWVFDLIIYTLSVILLNGGKISVTILNRSKFAKNMPFYSKVDWILLTL